MFREHLDPRKGTEKQSLVFIISQKVSEWTVNESRWNTNFLLRDPEKPVFQSVVKGVQKTTYKDKPFMFKGDFTLLVRLLFGHTSDCLLYTSDAADE